MGRMGLAKLRPEVDATLLSLEMHRKDVSRNDTVGYPPSSPSGVVAAAGVLRPPAEGLPPPLLVLPMSPDECSATSPGLPQVSPQGR